MWLKLWKMSSLLLFVNIQSLLMARRWNRLWDNSLQFNSRKKTLRQNEKIKNKNQKYEYLHIVWTICALMDSDMSLCLEQALKWQPYNINLLMCIKRPVEYILTTEISEFCHKIPSPPPPFPVLWTTISVEQPPQVLTTIYSYGTFWKPQAATFQSRSLPSQ